MYCIDSKEQKSNLSLFKQDKNALAHVPGRITITSQHRGTWAALLHLCLCWSLLGLCSANSPRGRKAGHGQCQMNHSKKETNSPPKSFIIQAPRGLQCVKLASGHSCGQGARTIIRKRGTGRRERVREAKDNSSVSPQVSHFCSLLFGTGGL